MHANARLLGDAVIKAKGGRGEYLLRSKSDRSPGYAALKRFTETEKFLKNDGESRAGVPY